MVPKLCSLASASCLVIGPDLLLGIRIFLLLLDCLKEHTRGGANAGTSFVKILRFNFCLFNYSICGGHLHYGQTEKIVLK